MQIGHPPPPLVNRLLTEILPEASLSAPSGRQIRVLNLMKHALLWVVSLQARLSSGIQILRTNGILAGHPRCAFASQAL